MIGGSHSFQHGRVDGGGIVRKEAHPGVLAGQRLRVNGIEKGVVLLARIELAASPLPRECSTTELQQRDHQRYGGTERAIAVPRAYGQKLWTGQAHHAKWR